VHRSHRCRPRRTTAEVIAWFFRCRIDSFSAVTTVSLSITLTRLHHASFMDLSSLAVEQFGSTRTQCNWTIIDHWKRAYSLLEPKLHTLVAFTNSQSHAAPFSSRRVCATLLSNIALSRRVGVSSSVFTLSLPATEKICLTKRSLPSAFRRSITPTIEMLVEHSAHAPNS